MDAFFDIRGIAKLRGVSNILTGPTPGKSTPRMNQICLVFSGEAAFRRYEGRAYAGVNDQICFKKCNKKYYLPLWLSGLGFSIPSGETPVRIQVVAFFNIRGIGKRRGFSNILTGPTPGKSTPKMNQICLIFSEEAAFRRYE